MAIVAIIFTINAPNRFSVGGLSKSPTVLPCGVGWSSVPFSAVIDVRAVGRFSVESSRE